MLDPELKIIIRMEPSEFPGFYLQTNQKLEKRITVTPQRLLSAYAWVLCVVAKKHWSIWI